MIRSVLNALKSLISKSFAPALSLTEAAVTTRASSQPSQSTAGQVPAPAGDLLAAVIAAGLPADGVVGLDDLGVDDAGADGCASLPLVRAQHLAGPAGGSAPAAGRGCSTVPRTRTPPPRAGNHREGPPLDPVLDHVGHRVAHRPQVMGHRAADRDGELPPSPPVPAAPAPPTAHRSGPTGDRGGGHGTSSPATRSSRWRSGRGRVTRHETPGAGDGLGHLLRYQGFPCDAAGTTPQ